jgi:SulP family sulfate permease
VGKAVGVRTARRDPSPFLDALRERVPRTPGIAVLRGYRRVLLRGDVLAGLTVAAYAVPQSMAYAEVAGLPAIVGLWAMLAPLLLYAVLGSSPQLSMGPDATTAILTATALVGLSGGDPARHAALAALLALLVAAICLVAYVLRLGFLADLLSRPLLLGFFTALGLIMIAGQLDAATRTPVDGNEFVVQVGAFLGHLDDVHLASLAMAGAVLAFLLVVDARWKRVPGPLLAVLLSTGAMALFGLEGDGIATVGEVGAGFPQLSIPDVGAGDAVGLLAPAAGIALVGFSQNVLVARSFAGDRKRSRHGDDDLDDDPERLEIDANQELVALAAANAGNGVLQGFPVSSSASRAVLADEVGGRTQVTGLVTLATVVLVMVLFRPVLASFPLPALAAIVVFAGIQLLKVGDLVRLYRVRRSEAVLALATVVAVLAVGILYGILVAVGLSVLNVFRRVARPHAAVLGLVPDVPSLHDVEDFDDATQIPGLVAFRYDAPLCFANAQDFEDRAMAAVDGAEAPVRWFLLNAEANVDIDVTACQALERLLDELADRDITLVLARVKQTLLAELDRAGLLDRIGRDRVFPTLPTALDAFERSQGDPG